MNSSRLVVLALGLLKHAAVADLALEEHVVFRGQADAGAEEVLDGGALLEEGVDDGGAAGDERGLEEEGEDREDGVELLEVVALGGLRGRG